MFLLKRDMFKVVYETVSIRQMSAIWDWFFCCCAFLKIILSLNVFVESSLLYHMVAMYPDFIYLVYT